MCTTESVCFCKKYIKHGKSHFVPTAWFIVPRCVSAYGTLGDCTILQYVLLFYCTTVLLYCNIYRNIYYCSTVLQYVLLFIVLQYVLQYVVHYVLLFYCTAICTALRGLSLPDPVSPAPPAPATPPPRSPKVQRDGAGGQLPHLVTGHDQERDQRGHTLLVRLRLQRPAVTGEEAGGGARN